jgi:hypothetical protein
MPNSKPTQYRMVGFVQKGYNYYLQISQLPFNTEYRLSAYEGPEGEIVPRGESRR